MDSCHRTDPHKELMTADPSVSADGTSCGQSVLRCVGQKNLNDKERFYQLQSKHSGMRNQVYLRFSEQSEFLKCRVAEKGSFVHAPSHGELVHARPAFPIQRH